MSNLNQDVSKKVGVMATLIAAFVYWLLAGAGVNIKVNCLWCVNADPQMLVGKPDNVPLKQPLTQDSDTQTDMTETSSDEYDNCYGLTLNKPAPIAAPPRVLSNAGEDPNQTIRRLMFYITSQRNYIEQYESGINTFMESYTQNCK